jgi:hypothetical protein
MTLNCLQGLVGIKGRDNAAQVFVNTLPGISVLDFDKAINNESRNAFTRVDELIGLAIQQVQQDVQNALLGKYELKTFIENDVIGYFQENQVVMPAVTGNKVGIQVRCNLSPYLKLFIRQLKLFANHTGTVDLEIWDLTQSKLLSTVQVNAVAGEQSTIVTDLEFLTNKQRLDLFIGYQSTFDSLKTNLTQYTDDSGTASTWLNSWLFVRGCAIPNGLPMLWENFNGNSGTAGLSLDYSLQCSFDEKLCNIKKMLALPIQYKAGALMMKEMRYSKRLNGVVTCYNSDHKELQADYEAEYQLRMNQLMQNLSMPADLCFSCATLTESRSILP